MRVKTRRHNLETLERDLLWAHAEAAASSRRRLRGRRVSFVRRWFAPRAAAELLHFRALVEELRVGRTSCASSSRARRARRA